MDFGLKGKKALVCGGSKGLGFASAKALAQEGCRVFIASRDNVSMKTAAEILTKNMAEEVQYRVCDLTNSESRKELIKAIENEWGSLDIIIHNVGGPKASFVMDTNIEAWQEGFDRLFVPVVDLNHAFIPGMIQNKWGRIITVTSLSVMEPIPLLSISNALRSASTALSKTLSDEIAKFGITVNCVAPGLVSTDRTEELLNVRVANSGQNREAYMEEMLKTIPTGRLGQPEEYGAVVSFLCSKQAAYITGSTICVDGGKRRATY